MAVIRYYDNCFETDFIEVQFDKDRPLLEQIESHANNKYTSEMVECYDPETDKTFYVPLTTNEDLDVIIAVNGVSVKEDYKVQDNDIINVVYLPQSDETTTYVEWIGGLTMAGAIVGAVGLGVISGNAVGAIAGAVIGGVAGGILGGVLAYNITAKTITNKEEKGESLPDVRGSSNSSIKDQPYGFLVGKHLINPRVINDAYTEYSKDGKDAIIRAVYEIGYAPLKITDIKLDEFLLAPNGTKGNECFISGLLKGNAVNEKNEDDYSKGDISNHWYNNDIELEILQHNPNSNEINYGTIYPDVAKQKEINANLFFLNDSTLSEAGKSIIYKGKSFASRFRTNGVWFTESCPSSFSITLNAANGLYSSCTATAKDANKTVNNTIFGQIPLWFAIQWRPYSKFNSESDPEGSDYSEWKNITKWNDVDCADEYTDLNHNNDILNHRGNSIGTPTKSEETVSVSVPYTDVVDLAIKTSSSILILYSSPSFVYSQKGIYFGDNSDKYYIPNSGASAPDTMYWGKIYNKNSTAFKRDAVVDTESKHLWFDANNYMLHGKLLEDLVTITLDKEITVPLFYAVKVNEYNGQSESEGSPIAVNIKYITFRRNYYTNEKSIYWSDIGYWGSDGDVHKTLCNFQKFSGKGLDAQLQSYDFTGQVRLTATVELTNAEKEEMMRSDNTINGIEVRVIRISPNYLNETTRVSGSDDTVGLVSYSDLITVDTITTKPFNETTYRNKGIFEPQRFQSEEYMKKMCYIAIKAKADDLGTISQQIKKLSCTAESFSPVWKDYKWFPEGVKRVTEYYGYYTSATLKTKCNRTGTAYELNLNTYYISQGHTKEEAEQLAKKAYEKARGEGYSWYADEMGSNFSDLIKKEVFPPDGSCRKKHNDKDADVLPVSAIKYNDATAASGFMLTAVGPQNGQYALGYENIDLLSVAECYDAQQSVKDGSTYSITDGEHAAGQEVVLKLEANGYVYQTSKLEDLLSKIAIAGRCVYTYDNYGRIKLIMDKPIDYPRGVINQQNCISHSATYNFDKLPAGLRIQFPDEKDGYEQNSLYCWSDGNSLYNYKGNVENYNLDFVTNNEQAWSLGRYLLANRILNREVITAKIGMEGEAWGLGDVVVFQDEDLLIGDGSGRVQEILKTSTEIVGFIMDSVYTYTGETETIDGVEYCTKGVEIFTPKRYGNTRVQTFRLAKPNKQVTVNGTKYKMKVGETNLVLFDSPITISASVEDFDENDIVMFGELSKISALYRITKIKPDKGATYSCTLVQYTEDLYNYGKELPTFQNFMTIPSPTADGTSLSEVPTTVKEYVDNNTNLRNDLFKGMVAGSEPYYAVTNSSVMPDLYTFNDAKTEEEYKGGEFCSNFDLVVGHYNNFFRYLWSGVRYVYADGTKTNYITNVSLSVYGEQGAAGTDFRFDLSPENTFVTPVANGAIKESEINVSCFLYKETLAKTIDSIECYLKVIAKENKLESTTTEIKESDVYMGLNLKIPTAQLRNMLNNTDTFYIIVVCHFTDDSDEDNPIQKSRMATLTVSTITSGVKYYFYLDYTNIKINEDGDIYPEYIVATPLKLTTSGVYMANEGEGGTSIKYRIKPNGEYKSVGHEKVNSSDTYSEETVYHGKFVPQVAYKINADDTFDYSTCLTVECPDGVERALIFYNRANV